MAFQSHPGIQGRVFVPDDDIRARKHPCPDCFACQQCSDDRCRICRRDAAAKPARTSVTRSARHKRSTGCKHCSCR